MLSVIDPWQGVERLIDDEPLLRAILGAIDEGIHVVDTRGVTVFYNDAAARTDGLQPAEVIGRPLLDVFPSLSSVTSTLLQVLARPEPILDQQQTVTNYKGHRVTTVNSTYPIFVEGKLAAALEVAKDFTRVRELAESALDLRAALLRRRVRPIGAGAHFTFADLRGHSPRLQLVIAQARRAAAGSSPVLVAGETGTGKELLVQAMHNASPRAGRPFVAQNCAALPAGLLEGILFGTVRGGFTGAEDRPGLFELADGGTLFLDEINSMPLDLQGKLLRVLQDGRVRRVGDTHERQVDVRILAAAGEDPLAAVAAGRLRQDLFYRINVVFLALPPLRERREDIPLLCDFFLRRYGGAAQPGLSPEAMAVFQAHHWPGNVRELEHAIEGALQLCQGALITVKDLPQHMQGTTGSKRVAPAPAAMGHLRADAGYAPATLPPAADAPLRELLLGAERQALLQALAVSGGSVAGAARRLGIPRQTLQYRLRRLGLGAGAGSGPGADPEAGVEPDGDHKGGGVVDGH